MLVNVAPPKPTRLLSETERKALLTHDLSPGTPVSLESQKIPLYESRTSTLNNGQDLYNIHWDMLNEDILLSLEKENLFPEFYEFPKLELDLDTSWISAPLASPEVLSVSSSGLSLDSSFKNKGLSSASVKLETIQQSPDMKVKIDTPSKSSLDSISENKIGAVSGDVKTKSDTSVIKNDQSTSDRSIRQTHSSNECNIDGAESLPMLREIQKEIFNHSQLSNYNAVSTDHTTLIQKPFPLNNVDTTQADCDTHLVERHSPSKSNQFERLHTSDHLSHAGLECTPEHSGVRQSFHGRSPSPSPKVPSPANKRLHYSQSESYIETLSDKFKMKRSKEQGDIAHLKDTAKVYEVNTGKGHEKLLKPRESEPIFEESKLPLVQSAILETTSGPDEEQESLLMAVRDNSLDDSYPQFRDDVSREAENIRPELSKSFDLEVNETQSSDSNLNVVTQTESQASTITLKGQTDSSDSTATVVNVGEYLDHSASIDDLPVGEGDDFTAVENDVRNDESAALETDDVPAVEVYEPLITSVDSLLGDEQMDEMYSKTTRLSVSEGTYSGSEKRSSSSGQSTSGHSISGHSDEYPMTETDV